MASLNVPLKIALLQDSRTQLEIADAAGINPSYLSLIIQGHRHASPTVQKSLAKVLRKPVASLFPEDHASAVR